MSWHTKYTLAYVFHKSSFVVRKLQTCIDLYFGNPGGNWSIFHRLSTNFFSNSIERLKQPRYFSNMTVIAVVLALAIKVTIFMEIISVAWFTIMFQFSLRNIINAETNFNPVLLSLRRELVAKFQDSVLAVRIYDEHKVQHFSDKVRHFHFMKAQIFTKLITETWMTGDPPDSGGRQSEGRREFFT